MNAIAQLTDSQMDTAILLLEDNFCKLEAALFHKCEGAGTDQDDQVIASFWPWNLDSLESIVMELVDEYDNRRA